MVYWRDRLNRDTDDSIGYLLTDAFVRQLSSWFYSRDQSITDVHGGIRHLWTDALICKTIFSLVLRERLLQQRYW